MNQEGGFFVAKWGHICGKGSRIQHSPVQSPFQKPPVRPSKRWKTRAAGVRLGRGSPVLLIDTLKKCLQQKFD